MFYHKHCMPHQRSAVLLLLISHPEGTGRKVGQDVILIETAASKCSSGSSESILPGEKMSITLKVLLAYFTALFFPSSMF